MHLYFMVRGLKQQLELFEMFMQTQMFNWKRKNRETGQDEIIGVQGGLRVMPFGYEYIFPKECLNEVLTMLKVANNFEDNWNVGKLKTWLIRHVIGGDVKPIPYDYTHSPNHRYIEMRGVAIYLIGIKEDIEDWTPDGENYMQEML